MEDLHFGPSRFYYSSSLEEYNTLNYEINPANLPDVCIKDIDQSSNPIDFYKLGDLLIGSILQIIQKNTKIVVTSSFWYIV